MPGRPGTSFESRAERTVPGLSVDTGQFFLTGLAQRGPVGVAVRVGSESELTESFGDPVSYGLVNDSVEAALSQGAAAVWVSRVAGAGAALGTLTLVDGLAAPTLRIDALSVGDWSTGLTVEVTNTAGVVTLTVVYDGETESFSDLTTPAGIVAALASSRFVRAVDLASASAAPSNMPATSAAAPLAGGDDDRGAIVEADWTAALEAFGSGLGPGQVAAPGRTTTAAHQALLDHGDANNRRALLDVVNRASEGTATAAVAPLRTLVNARLGATFTSWLTMDAVVAGVIREVPASPVVAGLIARSDATFGPARWPIADNGGVRAPVRNATAVYTDAERTRLTEAGVNTFRDDPALGLRLYGFRSVSSDDAWRNFGHTRLVMHIQAQCLARQEAFVGQLISNRLIGDFKGVVESVLHKLYVDGSLDGDDPTTGISAPQYAFRVDVGPSVNTTATRANRELRANVYARFSESAEIVYVGLVKLPLTAPIAA